MGCGRVLPVAGGLDDVEKIYLPAGSRAPSGGLEMHGMTKLRKLPKQERQRRILDEAKSAPFIRISALAGYLGVSTETVRRDLQELCRAGLINRTYGGATAPSAVLGTINGHAGAGSGDEAARIGTAAAQRVRAGQTVMLSGGSIAYQAASEMARNAVNLIVVTCNARIASVVAANPTIQSILSPGAYDVREDGVTGEDTVGYLQQFNADLAIVEAMALSEDGPFDDSSAAAAVKRAMLDRAADKVLLVGKAACSGRTLRKICPLASLDEIITSGAPAGTLVTAARSAGVRFSVV